MVYIVLILKQTSIDLNLLKKETQDRWYRGKFPGLVFIKRISEHKRGTRHLHFVREGFQIRSFKKTSVLEKLTWQRGWSRSCFRTQGRLGDRSEAITVPGMFHMFVFLFLMDNTLQHTFLFLKHNFNEKKKKQQERKQTEAKGNSLHIRGLKESPTLTWLNR